MENFLVVDGHTLMRMGIVAMLKQSYSASVHEADDIPQALNRLKTEQFDLVLLDINIQGGVCPQTVRELRETQKDVKILALSQSNELVSILQFLRQGVNGYLSKFCSREQFLEAVTAIQRSQRYISAEVEEMIITQFLGSRGISIMPKKLSTRESEIAQLLVQGHRVYEISKMLDLRISTVSTIKRNIFRKLQVTNVVDLARRIRYVE